MFNEDTVKLLKECNAGIKMGVNSIDEVLDKVEDKSLLRLLTELKEEHQALGSEAHRLLSTACESGKEPPLAAQGMSWLKTNVLLAMDKNDKTVAALITDGCNMGIKTVSRYLNQYAAADACAKELAQKLKELEERLLKGLQKYL